nr:hypothetical protein [Tanacetum cinerariifolium]
MLRLPISFCKDSILRFILSLLTPYTRLRDKDLLKLKDPQVVVAVAKLLIINPNEFDLWKMRIEQYFLMTDYSLWEVILNGDSPIPTRVVDGVVQLIAPTTDAKSLMEAIEKRFGGNKETKFLRSLPSEWRTHTLIWRNKADLVDQSLDDLFNNLKIYEAESEGYHAVPPPYIGNYMPPRADLSFASDELTSSESDVSVPTSPVHDKYESGKGYHAVPPSYTGTFMPSKPDLIFHDALTDCDYYEKKMVQKPVWNHAMRVNHQNSTRMTHPHFKNHVVQTTVLTRSKLVPFNAARLVTTVVPQTNVQHQRPAKHVVNKPHSPIKGPINHRPSPKNSIFHQKVTTIKAKKVNANQGTKGIWGNLQQDLKDKAVIDNGCSIHMTGNISYVSDFEEINGGYVAFGGNPKGGKITGKGKIKTGKLDFDDVYFVKELMFNLFSVSQMRDKKNNILFTNTECVVLSSNFKLPNENHVLLRVPRENNMYNVDLKNIVPSGYLTCLFAKATLDVSNLWHRSLGYINFKTMNKLVKGIKREFSVARTSQQNGVAERKNRTLIEAARTMLADPLLPIPFWAEVVNTVYYVQNKVLVTKPYNKTPYELLLGRTPSIEFMRPFGCPITILNTLDLLRKFDGKADEGFLVGYSISSKAFRVFNSRTIIVQVAAGNQPNSSTGIQENLDIDADAAFDAKKNKSEVHVSLSSEFFVTSTNRVNDASAPVTAVGPNSTNSTNRFNAVGPSNNAVSPNFVIGGKSSFVDPSQYPDDLNMPALEDIVYSDDEEDVGTEADFSNLETSITVSPIPITRVYKDHHITQIIGDLSLAPQTRSMTRMVKEQGGLTQINDDDFYTYLPKGKRAIGSKWVFRNKKDEKGIVIRNTTRLVTQGHTQEEDIDYEEVFAPFAKIEAIWLFIAYASFMGFMVYKVVKALYGLHQAPRAQYETLANYLLENGFQRGKIDQTLFELCKAFEKLMKDKFQMSSMGELTFFLGIQVKQKDNGIFISQYKYVAKILREFGLIFSKLASTPIDSEKPLLKDPDGEDVDVSQGQASFGLVVPKDSPFNLVAYFDSDYARASLDRKSTIGGCQFLVRNVDSSSKFLMYPQFLQLMINAQVDDLSTHNTKYTSPALTQKVFANIRRIGKGFSGVDTPLFDGMLVEQQVQAVEDDAEDEDDDNVLKQRVKSLEKKRQFKSSGLKSLRKVVTAQRVESSANTVMDDQEDASKHGWGGIAKLDADEDVTPVDAKEDMNADVQGRLADSQAKVYHLDIQHAEKVLSMQDTDEPEPAEVEEVIEVVTAAKLMTEVVTTTATTTDAQVPKASAPRRRRGSFLERIKEEVTGQKEEGSKRKGDSLNQDAAKTQRINEEEQELKAHLKIVVNDDDVFTEATTLASKVPVIDYQIHHENNKPYYKITRVVGTHKLFISFITLLKSFDREDLEML